MSSTVDDGFSYTVGDFPGDKEEAERAAYLARLERRLERVVGAATRASAPNAALLDPTNPAGMRALAREIGSRGGAVGPMQYGVSTDDVANDDRVPLMDRDEIGIDDSGVRDADDRLRSPLRTSSQAESQDWASNLLRRMMRSCLSCCSCLLPR